jgi:hypothetical protein
MRLLPSWAIPNKNPLLQINKVPCVPQRRLGAHLLASQVLQLALSVVGVLFVAFVIQIGVHVMAEDKDDDGAEDDH